MDFWLLLQPKSTDVMDNIRSDATNVGNLYKKMSHNWMSNLTNLNLTFSVLLCLCVLVCSYFSQLLLWLLLLPPLNSKDLLKPRRWRWNGPRWVWCSSSCCPWWWQDASSGNISFLKFCQVRPKYFYYTGCRVRLIGSSLYQMNRYTCKFEVFQTDLWGIKPFQTTYLFIKKRNSVLKTWIW